MRSCWKVGQRKTAEEEQLGCMIKGFFVVFILGQLRFIQHHELVALANIRGKCALERKSWMTRLIESDRGNFQAFVKAVINPRPATKWEVSELETRGKVFLD